MYMYFAFLTTGDATDATVPGTVLWLLQFVRIVSLLAALSTLPNLCACLAVWRARRAFVCVRMQGGVLRSLKAGTASFAAVAAGVRDTTFLCGMLC